MTNVETRMSDPRPQTESGATHVSPRRLQFRLRHLLFLTTGVAGICGLVAWLGWEGLLVGAVAGSPIVTLIVVTRTNGTRPDRALRIGAILPSMVFAIGSVPLAVIAANSVSPTIRLMPGLVIAPILLGLYGGFLGVLASLPFLGLWYAVRSIRRTFFGQGDAPAP